MTNEQKAKRLEEIARDLDGMSSVNADSPILRAGAQALRVMDEMEADPMPWLGKSEPVKCGTFTDQTPLDPVVRVGRDLWKQTREQRDAALREVERLRGGVCDIGKMLEIPAAEYVPAIGDVFHKCDELLGNTPTPDPLAPHFGDVAGDLEKLTVRKATPDPRDSRIAELEAALHHEKIMLEDVLAAVDGNEINPSNYNEDDVMGLNNAYVAMFGDVEKSIARITAALKEASDE